MVTAHPVNDIAFLILIFAFYSLAGWILETTYRSMKQRHFVNPGLLKGPLLPIYGSFALIVVLTDGNWLLTSWEKAFVFFVFLSTIIEYLSGILLERFFHLQLWSYKDTPLNYKGRVALPFSLLWGGLGLVFEYYLQPFIESLFIQIPPSLKLILATIFAIYFVIDLVLSTILLHQFDISLSFINKISGHLETPNLHSARVYFRRLISTYPKIRHTLSESVSFIQEKQAALEHLKRDSLEKIRHMKSDK
ncbi:MAG: putative ABC transporter permease [Carboxydocellales bacterium]